ncbi:alpha/beta hydrolase [Subtercola sp. YIM 133946]|uniref:alpha/beta hydrolase n=1 Tax=Subtercola sp. YIM 133946 TaxID=3118909 RepID=UPI002F92D911
MPTFIDESGVSITYYVWSVERPRGIVQISHGLGEHATRYERIARELNDAGYSVYANDHRGHGQTGLDQYAGDHTKLGRLGPGGLRATVASIRQFTELITSKNPGMPVVLLGHSWGSLMAQKVIDRSSAGYAGVVLSGTAYRMPGSMDGGDLSRRHRPAGAGSGHGYEWLSRDLEVQQAAVADELMFEAKVLKLFGVRDGLRLFGRPAKSYATDLPVLILAGSDDILGGEKSVLKLAGAYRRAQLHDVTVKVYPDARHEVLLETNRDEVVGDLIAWLDHRLVLPTSR